MQVLTSDPPPPRPERVAECSCTPRELDSAATTSVRSELAGRGMCVELGRATSARSTLVRSRCAFELAVTFFVARLFDELPRVRLVRQELHTRQLGQDLRIFRLQLEGGLERIDGRCPALRALSLGSESHEACGGRRILEARFVASAEVRFQCLA